MVINLVRQVPISFHFLEVTLPRLSSSPLLVFHRDFIMSSEGTVKLSASKKVGGQRIGSGGSKPAGNSNAGAIIEGGSTPKTVYTGVTEEGGPTLRWGI